MAKRPSRATPAPAPRPQPTKPAWPQEGHSGEGSASALETLKKLERRDFDPKPPDPSDDAPR